jgi:hypothetical protein
VAKRELRGRTNPAAPPPPPLRRLGRTTSDGYAVAAFAADVLGQPFHPWQRRAAILAGERRADGRLRYRRVLVVVGRRNGKSYLAAAHLLWRAIEHGEKVLACAQNLKTARELWRDATALVMANPTLAAQVTNRRESLGDETLRFANGGEYRLVTADERAPRGLTCQYLVLDELALQRGDRGMAAFEALDPTVAVARAAGQGQLFCASSGPFDDSTLMTRMLDAQADDLLVLRWSTPEHFAADDPRGWPFANPSLGHPYGLTVEEVGSAFGLFQLNGFKREYLAQQVAAPDSAIPAEAWAACADPASTLDPRRVALCFDVAPGGAHASLVAAQPDGASGSEVARVRIEVVDAWTELATARAELAGWVRRIRPAALGWWANGPAAALASTLAVLPRAAPIAAADAPAACMELVEIIRARRLVHNGDPLLVEQAAGARRRAVGDRWVFDRRDGGAVDAVWAAAGAVRLAQALPKAGKRRMIASIEDDGQLTWAGERERVPA